MERTKATMRFFIGEFEIPQYALSEWDGLPVKNHLPKELKSRLKTESQWADERKKVKENAVCYELHPSWMSKKTCRYFLDADTETWCDTDIERNCVTCRYRSKSRYCFITGSHVGKTCCCSEYDMIMI